MAVGGASPQKNQHCGFPLPNWATQLAHQILGRLCACQEPEVCETGEADELNSSAGNFLRIYAEVPISQSHVGLVAGSKRGRHVVLNRLGRTRATLQRSIE